MSFTIVKDPIRVTPAGNTVMFVLDSNLSAFIYANVRIRDQLTGTLIASLRIYPTPANPARVHIELSKIMQSYITYKFLDYYSTIVAEVPNATQSFYLQVDEVIQSGTTTPTMSTLTTGRYNVFKGKLDTLTFKNYTRPKYTLDGSATYPVLFSTLQPRTKRTLSTSDEALYFMQDGAALPQLGSPETPQGRVTIYDKQGVLITTFIINVGFVATVFPTKVFKVNMAPAIIAALSLTPLANIGKYTFSLFGDISFPDPTDISEVFTYIIEDGYCNAPPLHVYWVNKFGNIDTYSFMHPMNSMTVERLTMQKPPYRLGANGFYNNFEGVTFNVVDAVINTGARQSIKAVTRNMSDEVNTWLSSILYSPQVFIKVQQDLFIPVTVQETTTDITPRRYINGLVTKEFTFKLAEGFTPDFKL
jgi:hypothetical protein